MANRTILCISRSYLSHLLPVLGARDEGATYIHIVQTDREEAHIKAQGQEVVLNLQEIGRQALRDADVEDWREPDDFRAVTSYSWSPLYADRYLPNYTPEQHLKIAGAIFRRLEEIFATRNISALLSEPVALFTTHVAFYFARRQGAKVLLWANCYTPEYFYFTDGIDLSVPSRVTPLSGEQEAEMAAATRAYIDGVVEDRRGPAFHPLFVAKSSSPLAYFRQRRGQEPLVFQPGMKSRLIQRARLLRAQLARRSFPARADFITAGAVEEHRGYLRSFQTKASVYDQMPAEYATGNVMYPLQYEPEASLIYFAPDFQDQAAFVETVLRALPDGHLLWVKEHPNQFGALGLPKWRALKRRYGNLRFVQGLQSGRQLIRRCGLVVAISSSAGMDALVLGRRVIVAGKVPYRNYPGALPIESGAEIARALNDPANYGEIDNRAALIDSVVAFGRNCYLGDPQPAHHLFGDTNLDLLVKAIRTETGAGEQAQR